MSEMAELSKEDLTLFSWRRELAESLGYPPGRADEVALSTLDLRRMGELVAHGCPLELAERIVR